jgi:hypothetical protein
MRRPSPPLPRSSGPICFEIPWSEFHTGRCGRAPATATLRGIPAAAFDYRLGNRSALEWVIDQYRISTDARSGIVNDPNREDDPQYILRLIGQVITVSLETQQIIGCLPSLKFD